MIEKDDSINIMIIEDHALVREGLTHYMSRYPEFHVCGEAESGKKAVQIISMLHPDIILQDLTLPDMDGLTLIQKILKNGNGAKVLILAGFSSDGLVSKMIQAGAAGFVYKDISHKELANAIHQILDGEIYLDHKAMTALIKSTKDGSNTELLTPREEQILKLVATGFTNAQIAQRLSICCKTVDFHIGNILTKMHVSNRTEAAVKALKREKTEINI